MRILYVAMKYDYGKPEQGYSFEHYNFYDSLHHMGHKIIYFDFMTLMQKHGRKRMNDLLLETVMKEKKRKNIKFKSPLKIKFAKSDA